MSYEDRKLLEQAAKAAGMDVHWGRGWQNNMLFREICNPSTPLVSNIEWNPLEDDGDAFRLAVKLRIVVAHSLSKDNAPVGVRASCIGNLAVTELFGDDAYAATRRAIVRAASTNIGET